ncbi:MAG: ABC transporter ATP-binding protein [Acidimicrobiales bacterium]
MSGQVLGLGQGHDVVGRPGRAAYMPQKDLLLPWRRVLDNAILGAELDGVPREQARGDALALFDQFGLTGFERSWPAQLSGGMRQRLALLRTFLLRREVLLLDEPFGALDVITRGEMVAWLQGVLLGAGPTSVLFVTHDVEEALLLSDRVVVLSPRPGRIEAEVAVPFERPRPPGVVAEPRFVALRATVMAALAGGRG